MQNNNICDSKNTEKTLTELLVQKAHSQAQLVPQEIVFIDAQVTAVDELLAGVKAGIKTVVIESTRDGVQQISQVLAQYHNQVSQVHLVCHGAPGCLYLGQTELSLGTYRQYESQLQEWNIDRLLLYGCRVAAGYGGAEFIEKLRKLTNAEITASTTLTGNTAGGGNWELEVNPQPGSSLAFRAETVANYSGVLAKEPAVPLFEEEFKVNSYTNDKQRIPSVTRLNDGGFVVTWESNLQDGSGYGIYGQRYNAAGGKVGSEFRINSQTNEEQSNPSVAGLNNGDFVVTWHSEDQDGSGYGIYGQRYNASGVKVGSEFRVNTYTVNWQRHPSVTGLNDGGFVVTWHSEDQDGSGYGIYGQRYNASGTKEGGEFRVNTHTVNWQIRPSVAELNDGGFVVTWHSKYQDGSIFGIYGQRYNASGVKVGSEFQINTATDDRQIYPSVTGLNDGGFVVTWESNLQDGSGYGAYGQQYDAEGKKVGSEFQVNTYTDDHQGMPSVTGLNDGDFVIAWHSKGQDGSEHGIYGQIFVQLPTLSFETASNLTEPDTDGEFKLTLSRAFPIDMTVPYTVSGTADDGDDFNSLSGSVVIPAGDTEVTIPVSVMDDRIDEETETITLELQESPTKYKLLPESEERQQTIEINDNDTAGITVDLTSGTTTEAGGQTSFEFKLDSKPLSEVTIDFSHNSDEGTLSTESLTFTPTDWNTAQTLTVTGQDDLYLDGDQIYTIASTVTSSDTLYEGMTLPTLEITNQDDPGDAAIPTLSFGESTNLEEPDTDGVFKLTLSNAFPIEMTVPYTVSGTAQKGADYIALSGSVVIPAGDTEVTIPVEVIDNRIDEETETITLELQESELYNLLPLSEDRIQSIEIIDNDTAGITVDSTSGTTTEAGGETTFGYKLNSKPLSDVTINFNHNSEEGTLSTSALTFTPDNWNTAQTLTVTGEDDFYIDGDQIYSITTNVTSSDAKYHELAIANLEITNTNDDEASIIVKSEDTITSEDGSDWARIGIKLGAIPTDEVTIDLLGLDETEGLALEDSEELSEDFGYLRPVSALNFDSSNWNEWQYVQIQGVDDRIDDDDQTYTLTFDASGSADSNYLVLTEAELLAQGKTVEIVNKDNDTAGIELRNFPEKTEEGVEKTFEVMLNSQPTSEVELVLTSSDVTEGVVSPGALTFTPENYEMPQTVTLTGVDDQIDDILPKDYQINITTETKDEKYTSMQLNKILMSEDTVVTDYLIELITSESEKYQSHFKISPELATWMTKAAMDEETEADSGLKSVTLFDGTTIHEAGIKYGENTPEYNLAERAIQAYIYELVRSGQVIRSRDDLKAVRNNTRGAQVSNKLAQEVKWIYGSLETGEVAHRLNQLKDNRGYTDEEVLMHVRLNGLKPSPGRMTKTGKWYEPEAFIRYRYNTAHSDQLPYNPAEYAVIMPGYYDSTMRLTGSMRNKITEYRRLDFRIDSLGNYGEEVRMETIGSMGRNFEELYTETLDELPQLDSGNFVFSSNLSPYFEIVSNE